MRSRVGLFLYAWWQHLYERVLGQLWVCCVGVRRQVSVEHGASREAGRAELGRAACAAQAEIFLGGLINGSLAAIRAKGRSLKSQVGGAGQGENRSLGAGAGEQARAASPCAL